MERYYKGDRKYNRPKNSYNNHNNYNNNHNNYNNYNNNHNNYKYNNNKNRSLIDASKFLTYVLRHKAVDLGLKIEETGFVKLEDIFSLPQAKKHNFTIEMVQEIVKNDEKGRFELVDRPPYYIRAVQGHSMEQISNEEALTKIKNIFIYPTIVHGTYYEAWNSIKTTGLNKMNRNAVHFSIGYPGENQVISGMRKSCEVFIEINGPYAYYNDVPFFISKNDVVLSPGIDGVVPNTYFKRVLNREKKILYVCNYDMCIFFKDNKIILYDINGEIASYDNNIVELNSLCEFIIQKNYVKSNPIICIVDKKHENDYIENIKINVMNKNINYPGLFIDYLIYDDPENHVVDLMKNKKITAENLKNVDINWKEYYSNL